MLSHKTPNVNYTSAKFYGNSIYFFSVTNIPDKRAKRLVLFLVASLKNALS